MKQKVIAFFNRPHHVLTITLVIALVIGVIGYLKIHKAPTYQFVSAHSGTIAGDPTGAPKNLTLGFVSGGRIKSVLVKVGDSVKSGQTLATLDAGNALGAVTQAQAAYVSAQANYDKVINGATGTAIDVAKAAVNTALVNLDETTKQQNILVDNAHRNLLNSTLEARSTTNSDVKPPTLSGSYHKNQEGSLTLSVYLASNGSYFSIAGLAQGSGLVSTIPQPIADTGLSISFPESTDYGGTVWTIDIPNTKASNYVTNYNAYQAALQTKSQAIAAAQATLSQAQASLAAVASAARPEDVAAAQAQVENAKGALQIAQAAYQNTIITAPADGTVTAVSITPGQITAANSPAIEFLAKSTTKEVAILIPTSALIPKNGKYFVEKKNGDTVIEQEVIIGVEDDHNVEIISGLQANDEVVVH